MNLEQRISNLERNSSKTAPGAVSTYGRIELVNTTSTQSINPTTYVTVGNGTGTTAWTVSENLGGVFTHTLGSVTCIKAGRYSVSGTVRWDSNNTAHRQIMIRKNVAGSSVDISGIFVPVVQNMTMSVSVPSIRLAANDTLDLVVYQNAGTTRTLVATTGNPFYFIIEYLGA
jgi:hypothetical protein